MAITLQLWEDTGSVLASHGTTRNPIENIGFRNSGTDDITPYADYPLIRPVPPQLFAVSFPKYNYWKIFGTYPRARRPKILITGNVNGAPPSGFVGTDKVRIYFNLTNIYTPPAATLLSGSFIDFSASTVLYPFTSGTGPELATTYIDPLLTDTTYWTAYLVTQLYMEQHIWDEFGNIGNVDIKFSIDEFESTNI